MRICSYNVNGLRALYRKNGIQDLYGSLNPDILCMQEVRCDEPTSESIMHSIDPSIGGSIYPNNHNIGYAGVATYWLGNPYECIPANEIIHQDLDNNLYFSGRVQFIPLKMDCSNPKDRVILINVYTLNSDDKDELRQEWDKMFYSMINILRRSFSIIIVGDLNVVKDENDHWKGLSHVVNQGPGLMDYEHQGLLNLLELGFIDSYKIMHPRGEKKSWFSYRGRAYEKHHGWRLDYILVDKRIQGKIISADIYEDFCGSDHRPIILDINL